jgi:hypothetical protein
MHDAANEKTSDQVPGTNTGAKTTLVTQFERFTTSLEYHVYSFFVRTQYFHFYIYLDSSELAIKKGWPHKSIVTTLFLHNVDLNTAGKYNKPRQKKQPYVLADFLIPVTPMVSYYH